MYCLYFKILRYTSINIHLKSSLSVVKNYRGCRVTSERKFKITGIPNKEPVKNVLTYHVTEQRTACNLNIIINDKYRALAP